MKFREVLHCSCDLSNKVSNIIRRLRKYVAAYMYFTIISSSIFYTFYLLSVYIWFYSCLIL
jgi:hypothetical protein